MWFIFLLFSFLLAFIIWKRKSELIVFLFPFVMLRNELAIKKPLSKKIIITADIIITVILILIGCLLLSEYELTFGEKVFTLIIFAIIIEWAGIIIAKIISVAADKFSFTYDGLFLLISSIWVFMGTYCNNGWNQSWFSLIIILFIAINLSISFRYMIRLCIKREEFLKKEFGEVTSANQIAAIVLLISEHIYSFVMLIYLLINSNMEFILSDSNNDAITKVSDIIYYVIITYTTVGYGDITPHGIAARIIAVMISVTGFFMSVVVVGIIIGTTINKKSNIAEEI